MSDHDIYRRLMRETEASAPTSAVGRFVARTWNRVFPERPDGLQSARESRQMLREIREQVTTSPESKSWMRRLQAQTEAEMVRTGEIPFSETSIPVRAGIEAIQERIARREGQRTRQSLARQLRAGAQHIEAETLMRDRVAAEMERAAERAAMSRRQALARQLKGGAQRDLLEVVRQRERDHEAIERQRVEDEEARHAKVIADWERMPQPVLSPAQQLELLRGVSEITTDPSIKAWLGRREAQVNSERRKQLLRQWQRTRRTPSGKIVVETVRRRKFPY